MGAGYIEDLGLAVGKYGHNGTLKRRRGTMVRLFRHPVNAADLPERHSSAESPFTVKTRTHYPHRKSSLFDHLVGGGKIASLHAVPALYRHKSSV
jgi:hypothetical protein